MESPEDPEIEKHEAIHTEHARLQSVVVKAAKRRRKAKLASSDSFGGAGGYIEELHAAMKAEHAAVDALTAFEAEHKIGE